MRTSGRCRHAVTMTGLAPIVLVHGGWHGGWCWRRVAGPLRAAGREVHTPTLTGLGDRAHLSGPGVGLATHVQDVVALLECEDLRDVVLVGHSSSGAVITGVAQKAPERIGALWYLDAFVPGPGSSVLDLLSPPRRAHFESLVRNGAIVLEPESAMDGWAVRDPADRRWLGPLLCPHPFGGLADPLPDRPVPPLPLTYVHCTDKPGGDSFAATAEAMRADPAARVHVLDTGHDAMVTAHADVVRLLLG